MQKTVRALFYKNAAWNTFDAIGTQSLVVTHHVLLQLYAGARLHGIIGTIFSVLYMTVLLANMGFDFSCAPFIGYYTTSKETTHSFIRTKLAPQWVWIYLCATIGFVLLRNTELSDNVALVLAGVFITESCKKTLKTFLQLLFYTKATALCEFVGMCMYMLGVWGWYYTGHGVSVLSSFFILFLASLCQNLYLIGFLYHWYNRLPEYIIVERPAHLTARIMRSRFWISTQRILEQVFSNNFLVPFFALSCGFQYASYFKIISSIARWISLVGDKTFGMTSLMLLARTPALFDQLLPIVNRIIVATIFIALPILLSVGSFFGYYYCSISSSAFVALCILLIILRFIDMACVAYERWLLIQERMMYTVVMALVTTLFVYICIVYIQLAPVFIISLLIGTRIFQAILYALLFNRIIKMNRH